MAVETRARRRAPSAERRVERSSDNWGVGGVRSDSITVNANRRGMPCVRVLLCDSRDVDGGVYVGPPVTYLLSCASREVMPGSE